MQVPREEVLSPGLWVVLYLRADAVAKTKRVAYAQEPLPMWAGWWSWLQGPCP